MVPFINSHSQLPIYEQIYNGIAADIITGKLMPGESLPSIRFVATELKISVIGVKKAWELLEIDGLIYTIVGSGSYVATITDDKLQELKLRLIKDRLEKDAPFFKQIGATKGELLRILSEIL